MYSNTLIEIPTDIDDGTTEGQRFLRAEDILSVEWVKHNESQYIVLVRTTTGTHQAILPTEEAARSWVAVIAAKLNHIAQWS